MSQTQSSGVQGRGARALAPALLLGTAVVVAVAVVHSQTPCFPSPAVAGALDRPAAHDDSDEPYATATLRHHHRSTFLWISASILLSACSIVCTVHVSTRARAWLVKWKRANLLVDRGVPVDAVFYTGLSALSLGVGVYGLWTCSTQVDHPDPDPHPEWHPELRWPTAATATIAVTWIVAAVVLLGMGVAAAVRDIRPGQETPPALMLLRCSCCSPAVQRAVLALPFAILTAICGTLWHQVAAVKERDDCAAASEPARLLLGSTLVFGAITLALGVAIAVPRACRARLRGTTHAHRRIFHAVVLCFLVAFSVTAIAWAVKSCHWLGATDRETGTASATTAVTACSVDTHAVRAVRFSTSALFLAGGLLLALTSCCRLERHLLPTTAATPHVDLSMLSPHAIRPPALTHSPAGHDAV